MSKQAAQLCPQLKFDHNAVFHYIWGWHWILYNLYGVCDFVIVYLINFLFLEKVFLSQLSHTEDLYLQ